MSSLLLILALSCTKHDLGSDCIQLKNGVSNNNINDVSYSVNQFIAKLGSRAHTNQNLIALAQIISTNCSLDVEVLCYGCIYTLPAQSELKISFLESGNYVSKVIDISENSSGEMKFANMHE